jgi:hypothetical protein
MLAVHAAGKDELVLERVLPACQLGDRNLITARFQRRRADDVGEVRSHFAPVGCAQRSGQGSCAASFWA